MIPMSLAKIINGGIKILLCRCDRQPFTLDSMHRLTGQLSGIRRSRGFAGPLDPIELWRNGNLDKNCLIDDFATHTIEIKLPNLSQTNFTNENFMTGPCDPLRNRLRGIANVTRALTASMQHSIRQLVERIQDLIPEIPETPRRRPRAFFSFGG
jgi:hypothetical protein